MEEDDTLAQYSSGTIDLHVVLARLEDQASQLSFLENLYHKIILSKTAKSRLKSVLEQTVILLAPLYEKQDRYTEAAGVLEEAGLYSQAVADYLKVKEFGDAARCAEKAGDFKTALDFYTRANMLLQAADLAKRTGDGTNAQALYQKAIDRFVEQKEFRQAALAAERAGMVQKALELTAAQIDHVGYTDSKYLYQELVERALQANLLDLAIDLAHRGELYDRAIEIATATKQLDQIPAIYKKYLDSLYPKERLPVFRTYVGFLIEHGTKGASRVAYQQEINYLKGQGEYLIAATLSEEGKFPESKELYRSAMLNAERQADFAKAAFAATKLGLSKEAEFYRNLATMIG